MTRFIVAAILGLTVVASVSTSASAFACVARGTNGVSATGYGLIHDRAQLFALRHCRSAGGIGCQIVHCK
jgi:hypothetical protein